jgi:hypothetical protein
MRDTQARRTTVKTEGHQMKAEGEAEQNIVTGSLTRNPFGVMDVPDPNDREVMRFATTATLDGSPQDGNAEAWGTPRGASRRDSVEGEWCSRWNGGADPTIEGDTPDQWKQGRAEVRILGERIYLSFDWAHGARKGLIDARFEGPQRLIGKYINLSNPAVTRPWIGQIVSDDRIDGRWTNGRLDFRR